MTIVLVHGNPETAAIWEPLRGELGRLGHDGTEIVALSPPGFGAPVPEGFDATSDAYLEWLIGELEPLGGTIDLIGHDWGGGHVSRVALARPDLIRSWTIDIAGCFAPDYVWHDNAQTWQRPGDGEALVGLMLSLSIDDRSAVYESLGMTADVARRCAEAFSVETGQCILALYRSAVQPKMAHLGVALESAERRASLVIIATEDHYTGGPERAADTARRFGSQIATLDGLGHWWMLQDPARGASAIAQFLDTLDR
ncbi:MAG: alpha/beta fold hydrolase [Acidimicrobiia bacterium]